MEGTLLEWIEVKLSVKITQPLLNLRVPPLRWRGPGAVTRYEVDSEGSVTLACAHGGVQITGLSPRIWRVVAYGNRPSEYRSESVVYRDREPLGVQTDEAGALRVRGREAGALEACVEPSTARLTFRAGGRDLHADGAPAGFRKGWVHCRKRAPEPEAYLGFGEKSGGLFKNGARLRMWNTDNPEMGPRSDPIYQSCPLQVALRRDGLAHALFFDNPHFSEFRVGGRGGTPETRYTAAGNPLVYYVLAGPTLPDVLEQLTRLTGRPPLPPRWMLGHHHSRWDPEESQEKVLATAREFRRRRIPCDVIHLDIGHMEGYRCFTWSGERFPEPKTVVEALHRLGFRVMVIVDPGIKRDPSFTIYREGRDEGLFCTDRRGGVHHSPVWPGPAAFPDFTAPRVRAWWGRLFARYLELGVDGFWLDMNEPSVFTAARTLTRRVRHGGVGHRSVHNLYGLLMARASYEGVRSLAPTHRPYLFTRAAFTGVQRYAGSWTGDNLSSWEHLRLSIPMLLNLGLSGQSLVGPDLGGFRGHPDPELMARWLELGILYPFCRNHTSRWSLRQEIWGFGEEVEAVGRRCLELRSSLQLYLYTLAWEASRTGAPMIRPLLYEFPDDPACRDPVTAQSQVMLGPHLLAAPVLAPGKLSRSVYLPPAPYWEDWWTGARLPGGQRVDVGAPLGRLPLYVRAGAALPLTEPAQHSTETAGLPVRIRLYPAERVAGALYLDDGVSMSYQREEYTLLRLEGRRIGEKGARQAAAGREGARETVRSGPGSGILPEAGQPPRPGRLRVYRESGTLSPVLGGHPLLTVEVSAGSPGARRLSAVVESDRLPWEWDYSG